jgi:hypothetical protein
MPPPQIGEGESLDQGIEFVNLGHPLTDRERTERITLDALGFRVGVG